MAALHQPVLGDFDFKQKRRKYTDSKESTVRKEAKPEAESKTIHDEAEVQFLKAFDLDYTYGPAAGLSRSERWERAKKLGLNPDPRVKQLIQQHPTDPRYTECLWKDTLVTQ